MSAIFKLDGTIVYEDDVKDEQQDLKDRLGNYDHHIKEQYQGLRSYRNHQLIASDWTQGEDSPLNSDKKAEWQSYRTKLRELPNSAKAPIGFEESDIPLAPGQSSVPTEALSFIKSHIDPLGIGASSWVGVGTDGVYFKQTRPCAQITFDSSSKVGGISTDKAVIGTHDTINFELNITDLASISLYDYKIKSQPETLFVDQTGVVTVVPDSNFVGIATVPISISGAAGTVTSPITIEFSYIVDGQEYETFVGVVTT